MPRYSTHQRIQWFPKRTKKTPGRVESLLKTGLIFQLSCSTLHFQVDLTISDRYSPPKSHPFFEKEKKSSKNLHFWGFLSSNFIISGFFLWGPNLLLSWSFFSTKNAFSFPTSIVSKGRRSMSNWPWFETSQTDAYEPPILNFLHLRKLWSFFFQMEKRIRFQKIQVANISGVMGLFPKSSPKTMKKRRVYWPDWFFWCQYLQVMLGRFSFRVTVTTGTVAGQLTSQDWSDATS